VTSNWLVVGYQYESQSLDSSSARRWQLERDTAVRCTHG
jgi:hypothetical protein